MNAADPVRLVRPADRVEGERPPGMMREQAIAIDGMWAGLVRTEAQMTTGWHHHADYDTSIYVVDGRLRMELGPGGSEGSRQVQATSCMRLGCDPSEGNPANAESHIIVVRAGRGPAVINVDGPAPGWPVSAMHEGPGMMRDAPRATTASPHCTSSESAPEYGAS